MKKNWGYSITEKRSINFKTADFSLRDKITEMVPSFSLCIGCGGCTASCSAGRITDFNFRRLHHLVRRGQMEGVTTEIQKCMLCGKCSLVCPRGVNTRGVILTILKYAK